MKILQVILFAFGFQVGALGAALAESPPPFPEFEAKRLKPPAPGTKKRIQVQIAPAESTAQPSGGSTRDAAEVPARHGWFWETILPQDTAVGPGRLTDAMELLSTPEARAALAPPRLQSLQDIAQAFGLDVMLATVGTEVSPALVLAVIYVESSGQADAVSGAGAEGLMQLIPATSARFEVADPMRPRDNIRGGVAYLDWLMQTFQLDPILALAAYNAGENAVRKNNGVPPYNETRDYVPKVLSAFSVARGLCVTPPLLASDGCVFANLSN